MAATVDPINTRLSPLSTPGPLSASSSTGPARGYPSPPITAQDEPSASEDEMRRGRSKFPVLPEVAVGEDSSVAASNRPSRASSSTIKARQRGASGATNRTNDNVQRLTAAEMRELTSSPDSLPIAPVPQRRSIDQEVAAAMVGHREQFRQHLQSRSPDPRQLDKLQTNGLAVDSARPLGSNGHWLIGEEPQRPCSPRTVSTPPTTRAQHHRIESASQPASPRRYSYNPLSRPSPLNLNGDMGNGFPNSPGIKTGPAAVNSHQNSGKNISHGYIGPSPPSPIPPMIPLPPMSLPTHLQLELAAQRPSPLYIHQSHLNDVPYESYAAKLERLKNVLLLPGYLERTLYFGALACLDAWLYTFTILPIRFIIAFGVLLKWWGYLVSKEVKWLFGYVRNGLGRMWKRGRTNQSRRPSDVSEHGRSRSRSRVRGPSSDGGGVSAPVLREHLHHARVVEPHAEHNELPASSLPNSNRHPGPKAGTFRHRRTKSIPSALSAFHKADLLQGAVIICSSVALMSLDASRMYHFIRAQSAIKLYVIYNILEVGDRLLSALGQDILECLFSNETLSRDPSGRSKILLPMGMFALALVYNCLHSIALYYQVITLNVAVNSYSNALLTLLLSNQFVEIKSTVFKRFEKDNLFQLTCADIVERFHLWIMLLIIGMRNIVEVGAFSVPGAGFDSSHDDGNIAVPLHPPSILPHSFTVLPSWLRS
ncbi:hypothetical protein QQS21_010541, partial [Conoideocrella luteorostrata]